MAITLVTADGWAIEHTNLGTVKLSDLGNDRTRVILLEHVTGAGHADQGRVLSLLETLGHELQRRFQAESVPEAS
jgi:hypothetical protein